MKMPEFYNLCRESFSAKMFIIFGAFITIVSAVFTILYVNHEATEIKLNLFKQGEVLSGLLAHSSRTGVFAENKDLLEDAAQGIMSQDGVLTVSIFTPDKRPILDKTKNPSHRILLPDASLSRLKDSKAMEVIKREAVVEFIRPVIIETFAQPEEAIFFDSKGLEKEEKVIGYVGIALDSSVLAKTIKSVIIRNVIIAVIFLLSGSLLIFLTLRQVTRPLTRLAERARRLGLGETIDSLPVESRDEIGKLAVTFNDMADNLRKREREKEALGEQLRHAQKIEAIGTLARGIAHDFNNIMTTVSGSVHILHKMLEEDSPLRTYTLSITLAVSRARGLVESLLAFSRGQAIKPALLNINDVIRRLEPLLIRLLIDDIECNLALSEGQLMIIGDNVQLEQMIMNLVVNARDAMPDGGILTIETEIVNIDEDDTLNLLVSRPGRYALISVTDTGIGMDERTKARIFEPFFTTKEVGKGTGLGLSIAYGIIEQHMGHIVVYSEKGTGTSFRVYIPLTETAQHEEAKKQMLSDSMVRRF